MGGKSYTGGPGAGSGAARVRSARALPDDTDRQVAGFEHLQHVSNPVPEDVEEGTGDFAAGSLLKAGGLPNRSSTQKLYSKPPVQITPGSKPELRSGNSTLATIWIPRCVRNLNPVAMPR